MGRPGIMVYFDLLPPLRILSYEDKGKLFEAMLEYGQGGVLPEFDGMLALAWGFVKPKIDKDEAEYNLSVQRRQYATECRERKKKNLPEITFDDWLKAISPTGHHGVSMMTNDDQWYPTTTTTTTTTPATSTTTKTSASTAAAANRTEDATAATEDNVLKSFGGKLGKNVVMLTQQQVEDLLERMGIDAFDNYVEKLANFIIRNDARVASHYDTILKWWREDSRVEA